MLTRCCSEQASSALSSEGFGHGTLLLLSTRGGYVIASNQAGLCSACLCSSSARSRFLSAVPTRRPGNMHSL